MKIIFLALLFLTCCAHRPSQDIPTEYVVEPYDFSPYPATTGRQPSAVIYKYNASDRSCDGLPQLPIGSFPGSCVGLVADTQNAAFLFPRKIVQLPNSEIYYLVDMGGWSSGKGKIFKLTKDNQKKFIVTEVISKLNSPHDIEIGPDGLVYVGELGRIFRFNPKDAKPQPQNVLLGFPKPETNQPHIHPLVNFAFGKSNQDRWDLFVNVGSATDACKNAAPNRCAEEEKGFAAIRKYKYLGNGRWNTKYEIFANGLRNSMGLLTLPSGVVLQAENSRDIKNKEEPFEELNVIAPTDKPKHFGWPYCYNFLARSNEWNSSAIDCQNFEKPYSLLPPHSAPLDIIAYDGDLFPQLKNFLILSLHGYEDTGSRLIAYKTTPDGLPTLQEKPESSYNVWNNGSPNGFVAKAAKPLGGSLQHAPYSELIQSWGTVNNLRAKGSPVGVMTAQDGSIFIVEDKNKTVIRLARGESYRTSTDAIISSTGLDVEKYVQQIKNDSRQWSRYRYLRTEFFLPSCTGCHDSMGQRPENQDDELTILKWILSQTNWIVPGKPNDSLIYIRTMGLNGTKTMPQEGNKNDPDHTATLRNWILGLK
jgi:glucose/arabinose dehydrogenase